MKKADKKAVKKIAHYAPRLWAKGGIATYVRRLGDAQAAAGYEVVYFSRNPEDAKVENTLVISDDRELFGQARALSCDILHLHKPVYHLPENRVTTVRTMHGNQGSCPTGTRYLVRSAKPCQRHYSVAGCFAQHLLERCGSLKLDKVKRNFGGIKNEMELGKQLHTFTVSHFLKGWMIRTGFSEERLHVIKSPAPGARFMGESPREGKPRFAFIGRLVPEKGAQWLLKALAEVKADVHVDVAGDGPLRQKLEAFVVRNELQDNVTFHGWVNQENVANLMKNARAIVFPSIWEEPAGLITLEAAASGRPVIASRAGGIPEYALDDFSLLVAPNNVSQLAEAIDRLAQNWELANQMGACALRNAESRYTLDGFLEKQLKLYRMAMNSTVENTVDNTDLELTETHRN